MAEYLKGQKCIRNYRYFSRCNFLNQYISEVNKFMIGAGVSKEVVDDTSAE